MSPRTIIHFCDSTSFGGAERSLLSLLSGLNRYQWRRVLAYHDSIGIAPLVERAAELGVELWSVPPMPEGLVGIMRLPSFVRALHSYHPHVFHAHQSWQRSCKYGLLGATFANVPVVVVTAQLLVDLPSNRFDMIKQRMFMQGVSRYLAVSHDIADRLRRENGIPESRIQVVHNAYVDQFPEAERLSVIREQLIGSDKRPLILTLARLVKQKGLEFLIAAAAQTTGVRFVIAGDGPERASLEALARDLGVDDRVYFLGFREDIAELLAVCDLFVLPSLYEGLPLAVLEAMAAEKPVIASAIGGMDEVIQHGRTGLLVKPADPTALAWAIRALLVNPEWAGQLARTARTHVAHEFSTEVMARRVVEIYDELLARHEVGYADH